jgi:outer membrane protein TolC
VALAIVLGIGLRIYSAGKNAGRGEGSREQLDIDKQSMEQERTDFQKTLTANHKADEAAKILISQQQAFIATANSNLARLATSREQDKRELAKRSDAELIPDIRKKLNITPSDPAPVLNASELRQVDAIVNDYPKLSDTVKELANRQAATDKTVEGLNTRITSISNERDAALRFSNEMVGHYTAAYNAAQKHHSKLVTVLTLGLVRTKKLNSAGSCDARRTGD